MANQTIARAPYNFVPFASEPLLRYESPNDLPPHDRINPALLCGEITVTIQAKSPIFVGKSEGGGKTPERFFRTPNGKFAIPGSTVRGLVRENMQILGFGLLKPNEDFDDYPIFFREMAARADGVKKDIRDMYTKDILGVSPTSDGRAVPRNVKAGYLCKEGSRYVIYPTADPIAIKRTDPLVKQFWKKDGLKAEPPHCESIAYALENGKVAELRRANPNDPAPKAMKKGVLMFTGKPVGRTPNRIYIFPANDHSSTRVELSKDDVLFYQFDYEARRPVLGYQQQFWDLPHGKEEKPVFYVQHNGHTYFGMTHYPRVGYPYSLSYGLPEAQRQAWKLNATPLDYARATLGYTDGTKSAYRSRVSFGDFYTVGNPTEGNPVKFALLGPKPSYFPGYTVDGKPYIDSNFLLRGYKQYWFKDYWAASTSNNGNVGSGFRPLAAGTVFTGVIRYKNLHPDELGLLLLSLKLEDGCYQGIGKGKPYGYGRTQITVDNLREWDMNALYTRFDVSAVTTNNTAVDSYIAQFKQTLEEYGRSPDDAIWKDFFTMRRFVGSKTGNLEASSIDYMPLNDYRDIRTPLPTVQTVVHSCTAAEDPISRSSAKDLEAGMILNGIVRNIVAYGAFVDIGIGQNAMIHISEIPDERKQGNTITLIPGDKVCVKILKITRDTKTGKTRINLSLKQVDA